MYQSVASITAAELQSRLSDPRTFVLDVREPNEFVTGHVPGAVSIPMSIIPLRVADIPAGTRNVYVICASGGRSMQISAWLASNGITVTNVAGGTNGWVSAGLPVLTGA